VSSSQPEMQAHKLVSPTGCEETGQGRSRSSAKHAASKDRSLLGALGDEDGCRRNMSDHGSGPVDMEETDQLWNDIQVETVVIWCCGTDVIPYN
jgi:hypothetical protein